ncbi:hypothetical protein T4B_9967 [Trichinella pseudospiralis]|uniref:Uncharacterized protein n=1 Tax=Trichinella pseudospiralis TaxID=6337 RepID=A0A0V1GH31_TRIPS|nr:hypothetical protein T4B_9967 [Trichinella pseudospiralis]KRY97948.1 hypothetical protein T4C_58 [Trichinella pseudospiralis]
MISVASIPGCKLWKSARYKAVVTLELSRFHTIEVAFQKYLCDVSGR